MGGTDLHFHKYIGPYDQGDTNKDGAASPTQPQYSGDTLNERTIQDLLFLENRDRKYDDDVYVVRGIYNVQDADFNLSQFGMFLQNDTLFLTVHLNDIVERLGRKPMSGDVIEFPHMKEDYSLDESIPIALKRYYVVDDVNRAAEGFSQTWWPHLLRLKMKSMVDSQEFKDIIGDATTTGSVASYMSTYNREKTINDQVVAQAEADAPKAGFNYKQYYVAPIDERGNIRTENVNTEEQRASSDNTVNATIDTPASSHYGFYLDGDGVELSEIMEFLKADDKVDHIKSNWTMLAEEGRQMMLAIFVLTSVMFVKAVLGGVDCTKNMDMCFIVLPV